MYQFVYLFSGIVECSALVLLSKNFSSNIERQRKRDKEINRDREIWGEEGGVLFCY